MPLDDAVRSRNWRPASSTRSSVRGSDVRARLPLVGDVGTNDVRGVARRASRRIIATRSTKTCPRCSTWTCGTTTRTPSPTDSRTPCRSSSVDRRPERGSRSGCWSRPVGCGDRGAGQSPQRDLRLASFGAACSRLHSSSSSSRGSVSHSRFHVTRLARLRARDASCHRRRNGRRRHRRGSRGAARNARRRSDDAAAGGADEDVATKAAVDA